MFSSSTHGSVIIEPLTCKTPFGLALSTISPPDNETPLSSPRSSWEQAMLGWAVGSRARLSW
jgi:hypothetical protein